MKVTKKLRKAIAVSLAIVMTAALAGCGSGTKQQATSSVESSSQQPVSTTDNKPVKQPVTLKIYLSSKMDVDGVQQDPVAKEIEKVTGVTMDIVNPDENKFKVWLAGGDLPDIVMTNQSYVQQLIEGNNIIPLDDLVKTNGTDLLNANPERVDFSKKYISNGTGNLYFLPVHSGPNEIMYQYNVAYTIRWDYYKELGYPEVKDEDAFLKLLADMKKSHPKTDDGKEVYGVSAWGDWGGLWPFVINHIMGNGYYNSSAFTAMDMQNNAINLLLEDQSPLWKALKFLNKADRLDLLDRECFVQKFDNYVTKMKNNQYLSTLTYGLVPYGGMNAEFAKNGQPDKGYEILPGFMPYFFRGGYSPIGWNDKLISITENCKNPERAMDLLNFTFSHEGSRLINSGIKDVNWKIVDGKPELTDETYDIIQNKPDEMKKTGIGKYTELQGLHDSVADPNDGGLMNLSLTEKRLSGQVSGLDKEYCEYYNVTYPGQVIDKMEKEGKLKLGSFNLAASSMLPNAPDDIKRIDVNIGDYMKKAVAKLVLAKTDADFDAQKKKAIEEMKKMGLDKSNDFWSKAWKSAKDEAQQYMK